ncbi:MAG: hypothetical protein ACO3LT_06250 [Ilumatobacteraceae bacterium]|jgi:hypothetical protein
MSAWLIVVTGVIYAVVAADLALSGKTAMAITYVGYSFANIGLWMAAR